MKKDYSAIYIIRNLVNNKIYIGSAINVRMRWHYHRRDLRANKHCNIYLANSWNKYGEKAFSFEVLEVVENECMLIQREQYYLDKYQPYNKHIGYNICRVAGSSLGYKHTEESKLKVSIANKGNSRPNPRKGSTISDEIKNKISVGNKGQKRSEETIRNISIALKGKTRTIEQRRNMSVARTGISVLVTRRKVIQLTKDNQFIAEFDSIEIAGEICKINPSNICTCCKGKLKTYKGFIWMYKEDYERLQYNILRL